jgi:flagellar basal body-associated protein FliL
VLPWIILAVVAVPVLAAAFAVSRRRTQAAEHPAGETAAERKRIEQEFEDAEAFEETWRAEEHRTHPPESLY